MNSWHLKCGVHCTRSSMIISSRNRLGFCARHYITRGSAFEARTNARALKSDHLTIRSGKGGGNFSKEAIIESCGPHDGGGCKKRIETLATFRGTKGTSRDTDRVGVFLICSLSWLFLLISAAREDHPWT